MKYKVGDKVRIKSLDWYNENKDKDGFVDFSTSVFVPGMSQFCGKIVTIEDVFEEEDDVVYCMEGIDYDWTDEMIEGLVLVEEENVLNKWTGLKVELELSKSVIGVSNVESLRGERFMSGFVKAIIPPDGYIFKDERDNEINTTKIILEKKHDDKLKLESTKKVREYWSEHAKIYVEIYDDEPNECVFTHLWVVNGQRQKGHGKRALIEAETIAKELGCHTAYLKVETNSWMHEWYLRMGYKWHGAADKGYTWLAKNLTGMEKKKKGVSENL